MSKEKMEELKVKKHKESEAAIEAKKKAAKAKADAVEKELIMKR